MLSSLALMIHQFYIEHRKHWWIFDVTSMFHTCFQCFSTLKPAMFRLFSINDSLMKHRWIINESMMKHWWGNSYVYMFYGWIQSKKNCEVFRSHHFPLNWAETFLENLSWESKERKFEPWARKKLILSKLMIFSVSSSAGKFARVSFTKELHLQKIINGSSMKHQCVKDKHKKSIIYH